MGMWLTCTWRGVQLNTLLGALSGGASFAEAATVTELSLSVPTACWLEAYEAQRAVEESAAVGDCGSSGALCVVEVEETTREGEPAGGDGLSVRECICRLLAVVLAHVSLAIHGCGPRVVHSCQSKCLECTSTLQLQHRWYERHCLFGMQLPACCHGVTLLCVIRALFVDADALGL